MKIKIASLLSALTITLANANNVSKLKGFVNDKDIFGSRVFVENKGQFNASINSAGTIKYAYENGDEKIYFTSNGLVYKFIKHFPITEKQEEAIEHGKFVKLKQDEVHFVEMNWSGSNKNIQIEEFEKQNYYFSYGNIEYKSNVYKKIVYKNVYNGIDIEYVMPSDKEYGIKYNVILHPGANADDIKIVYSGEVNKIISRENEIIIKTPLQDIIEHAPNSFYSTGKSIPCNFTLHNNVIGFNFPQGYQNTVKVVIDPWVTNITTIANNNYGYDVDYDNNGNLFVYGGQPPMRTCKYNAAGALQWTFNGIVVVPAWNGGGGTNYVSNFVVNRNTGKPYIGQGWVPGGGTRVIRLDANGIYDNFISTAVPAWQEIWDMGYHCPTGDIYGLGGCPGSTRSAGLINQTTGAVTAVSFMAAGPPSSQDIVSNAMDDNGIAYIYYTSSNTAIINRIARINAAFNNTVWCVPSTYVSMNYCSMKNNYVTNGGGIPSNGFNCLAVNNNYLYYYDGLNLAAYNKATGTKIAFTLVGGNAMRAQGGIAVDDCDNVYLGGNGVIHCYKFTGTAFNTQANIPNNATTANKYIYDIKLDRPSNMLYVSGSGFVGTYTAIHSLNCIVNQYSVVPSCNNAVASVTTTISNPVFNYTWTNSGGVFSNTNNSAISSNTVNGLAPGNYTVAIQINAPCGPIYTMTFSTSSPATTITPTAKSCTALGSATATVVGGTAPISFTWTNSASTTSVATGFPNGVQTVTVSDVNGCKGTFTFNVNFVNTLTTTATGTNVLCNGQANGSASVTVAGGSGSGYTFLWNNGQTTPLAGNLGAGQYTVVMNDGPFCTSTATVLITQPNPLTLTINSSTTNACAGGIINLNSFAGGGIGPYSYTWVPGPIASAYNVSEAIAGNYNYVVNVTDFNGCTISNNINLTFNPIPVVTASSQTICIGDKAILSANGADTYTWNPGNVQGNTYTVTATSNMYLTVVGSALGGCSSAATATVIVNPLPVPVIAASNNKGCVPLCMTFTAANLGGSVQSCNWEFGDGAFASNVNTTDRCYSIAGNYTVKATVTDNNGCVSSMTYSLEAFPIPIADFNFSPLKPILNQDPEVTFTDASHAAVIKKWDWYFMNLPKPHSNLQNPTYIYTEAGTYAIALVVTSDLGCTDTIIKTIILEEDYGIYVPNTFTPNGDNLNDLFYPVMSGPLPLAYSFEIFDRWGELLYRSDNPVETKWNGDYKGKQCKNDVYVWKLNVTSSNGKAFERTGHVNLMN